MVIIGSPPPPQAVFAHAGDNLTLLCQDREEDDNDEDAVDDEDENQAIYWNTTAEAILPTPSSVILGKRLEQQLISVTNLHTGLYSCSTRGITSGIYLFVKGINTRIQQIYQYSNAVAIESFQFIILSPKPIEKCSFCKRNIFSN